MYDFASSVKQNIIMCRGLDLTSFTLLPPFQTLALWSLSSSALTEIHRTPLSLGRIHSLAFSPNSPLIVCVGGDKVRSVTELKTLGKFGDITLNAKKKQMIGLCEETKLEFNFSIISFE